MEVFKFNCEVKTSYVKTDCRRLEKVLLYKSNSTVSVGSAKEIVNKVTLRLISPEGFTHILKDGSAQYSSLKAYEEFIDLLASDGDTLNLLSLMAGKKRSADRIGLIDKMSSSKNVHMGYGLSKHFKELQKMLSWKRVLYVVREGSVSEWILEVLKTKGFESIMDGKYCVGGRLG